ncbi:ATP-binding protein [Niabella hibiscisoli]|uniref:ATP-binding protein n=1 Tax=Niabella hibiscisoli TaxID=1825928 RepID=UPI001F0DBC58|nr:ATP-binding protein [Niabella hibiscisoli]MCH5719106.1 ATP-binding protein [Niabella hibiscisoli]
MDRIPILKMGRYLLVTIQVDLYDRLALDLESDLVKDQGAGMNKQTVSHVFSKFYKGAHGQSKFSCLGMGLYVASTIMSDHDGSITVYSTPRAGSTFTIRIPLCQPDCNHPEAMRRE